MIDSNRRVLVHGDVSPKNVLVGPTGPMLVDAECATFSDPAFDVAFCLNHLLLKCLWNPAATDGFSACFTEFVVAYLDCVTWESPEQLERRAARVVPAFLLARIDGKSPVEYLDAAQRSVVRESARSLLLGPPLHALAAVNDRWRSCLR